MIGESGRRKTKGGAPGGDIIEYNFRQPGDLGVLREVFRGFSEEARTRGIASPALAGFAFVANNYRAQQKFVNSGIYLE